MAAIALTGNMIAPGGGPASGCLLNSYIRNTTTRSPLYSNVGLTVQTTNPYVGDADGRLEFYFDSTIEYEWSVTTSDGATIIWEADVVGGVVTVTYTDGVLIHSSWAPPLATTLGDRWAAHFGKSLPQFYLDDYYETTWQAALDAAATAASTAGGGIIFAHGREEYAFTGYPSALPAGVYVFGIPNYTRFKMPTTGGTLIRWTGGAVGSAKTLSGNVSAGDETISVTSGSDIATGDFLRMIKTDVSLTLGAPSQLFRVEGKPSTNSMTVANRAIFATATSDTYSLVELTMISGGGLYGVIFDGSACVATTCIGCSVQYMNGGYFDCIGGEYMTGSDPGNDSNSAGVLHMSDCWDARGLNDIWAYKSGTAGTTDIQFTRMGAQQYGQIHSEQSTGFGPGWYNCQDFQDIASIYSLQARQRAGKVQCTNAIIGRIVVDKPNLTGFAFTEGSTADVATVEYTRTDTQDAMSVSSLVRASNVVTMTMATDPFWPTGRTVTVAGAVSGDDMNGAVTLTRVSALVYTYADTGANETATGTITATQAASPSLWLNNTGSKVSVGTARFWGVTNSAGDIHSGANDSLRIGAVFTQWGTDPTFGGTATSGNQRVVREINNTPQQIGFATSSYLTVRDYAATSGATGYSIITRDSGGTVRQAYLRLNTASNLLLEAPSTFSLYLSGASVFSQTGFFADTDASYDIGATGANRFRDLHISRTFRAGGRDVVDAQGYGVLKTATAAQINDITHAVNVTGKQLGRYLLETTNGRIIAASGSTAGATWSGDGTTYTPV